MTDRNGSRAHVVLCGADATQLLQHVQIDKNVEREIVNHRTLLHPNIIKFREVSGQSHRDSYAVCTGLGSALHDMTSANQRAMGRCCRCF